MDKLKHTHGVTVHHMDADLGFQETLTNLTAAYAHFNETLFIVQNPSQQIREDFIEI